MIKRTKHRLFYYRNRRRIEKLLEAIVELNRPQISLPFYNNLGVITSRPVVGYNKTKIFIDVSGQLAYVKKRHLAFMNKTELDLLLEEVLRPLDMASIRRATEHLQKFKALEGKSAVFRHTMTGEIYRSFNFHMDVGRSMDFEDPAHYLPIQIDVGYINKVHYLANLEIMR